MNAKPISLSDSTNAGCSARTVRILGGVILLAGLVISWFVLVQPLILHFQSQSWTTAKCKITGSRTEVKHDEDGSRYRPVINYRFDANGQQWTGDTVTFVGITTSSRRSWSSKITRDFPVGAEASCYFDPSDPSRNVLLRSFFHGIWIRALTLLIVILGVVMVRGSVGSKRSVKPEGLEPFGQEEMDRSSDTAVRAQVSDVLHEGDQLDQEWDVPQKLKPTSTRLARVLGLAFFAAFWNGIVSVFVYQAVSEGFGGMAIFMFLFLIPFELVGLFLVGAFFHQMLALFNPVVEVALSTGAIAVGETLDIAWEISRGSQRLRKLKITIEGIESVTYVQGTDTKTDTQLFSEILVVDSGDPSEIAFGSAAIAIPDDTMHTFESSSNQIQWTVQVHGDIAWWPDVSESFPFRVKPSSGATL